MVTCSPPEETAVVITGTRRNEREARGPSLLVLLLVELVAVAGLLLLFLLVAGQRAVDDGGVFLSRAERSSSPTWDSLARRRRTLPTRITTGGPRYFAVTCSPARAFFLISSIS